VSASTSTPAAPSGAPLETETGQRVTLGSFARERVAALREGESTETVREQVMEEVRRAFRPEFLNRLDEILLFNRLSRAHMTDIVDIQLGHLRKLLADRKIELDVDSKALQWLANRGYDPVYGARPLKRVIQRSLQNPLATLILEGRVKEGETVKVTGTTKGRGFQGVVKRWSFGGGPNTHGNTKHRRPGSIGPGTDPSRVIKGKKMPGHYGAERHTQIGLRVEKVDAERNLIYVRGAVAGPKNGIVVVRKQG